MPTMHYGMHTPEGNRVLRDRMRTVQRKVDLAMDYMDRNRAIHAVRVGLKGYRDMTPSTIEKHPEIHAPAVQQMVNYNLLQMLTRDIGLTRNESIELLNRWLQEPHFSRFRGKSLKNMPKGGMPPNRIL